MTPAGKPAGKRFTGVQQQPCAQTHNPQPPAGDHIPGAPLDPLFFHLPVHNYCWQNRAGNAMLKSST